MVLTGPGNIISSASSEKTSALKKQSHDEDAVFVFNSGLQLVPLEVNILPHGQKRYIGTRLLILLVWDSGAETTLK